MREGPKNETNAVKEAAQLVSEILIYIPTQRIGCMEALFHNFFRDVITDKYV